MERSSTLEMDSNSGLLTRGDNLPSRRALGAEHSSTGSRIFDAPAEKSSTRKRKTCVIVSFVSAVVLFSVLAALAGWWITRTTAIPCVSADDYSANDSLSKMFLMKMLGGESPTPEQNPPEWPEGTVTVVDPDTPNLQNLVNEIFRWGAHAETYPSNDTELMSWDKGLANPPRPDNPNWTQAGFFCKDQQPPEKTANPPSCFDTDEMQRDFKTHPDMKNNLAYGWWDERRREFSQKRHVLLLKPGDYSEKVKDLKVRVGFYQHVAGLGERPDAVSVPAISVENSTNHIEVGALDNFWRAVENLTVDKMKWYVSQASPLRNVHVKGELNLGGFNSMADAPWGGGPAPAYASGGYASGLRVDGAIHFQSQQQFFVRNSVAGSTDGGAWNIVCVGVHGCEVQQEGDKSKGRYSVADKTPVVADKPWVAIDSDGKYNLMVPPAVVNSAGPQDYTSTSSPTGTGEDMRKIPFEKVYVARPPSGDEDIAEIINQKLAEQGKHVVLTPGIYYLKKPLNVVNDGTVLLGLGLATLIAASEDGCVKVNARGARVSGIMMQAQPNEKVKSLLVVGDEKLSDSAAATKATSTNFQPKQNIFLHDIFARLGGDFESGGDFKDTSVHTMVSINTSNVVVDNIWLWRADHEINDGIVKNGNLPVTHGLVVNGDDVTIYGLAVEHMSDGALVQWMGERGRTFFFQSELAYDIDQGKVDLLFQDKKNGPMAAYVVRANYHTGVGMGAYTYFRDYAVTADAAFRVEQKGPDGTSTALQDTSKSNVRIENACTVWLNGNEASVIANVINDDGQSSTKQSKGNPVWHRDGFGNRKSLLFDDCSSTAECADGLECGVAGWEKLCAPAHTGDDAHNEPSGAFLRRG